jgi:cell division protein FtsB
MLNSTIQFLLHFKFSLFGFSLSLLSFIKFIFIIILLVIWIGILFIEFKNNKPQPNQFTTCIEANILSSKTANILSNIGAVIFTSSSLYSNGITIYNQHNQQKEENKTSAVQTTKLDRETINKQILDLQKERSKLDESDLQKYPDGRFVNNNLNTHSAKTLQLLQTVEKDASIKKKFQH